MACSLSGACVSDMLIVLLFFSRNKNERLYEGGLLGHGKISRFLVNELRNTAKKWRTMVFLHSKREIGRTNV